MARTQVEKTKKPDPKAKTPAAATAKEAPKKVDPTTKLTKSVAPKDGAVPKDGKALVGPAKGKPDGAKGKPGVVDATKPVVAKPLTKPATKPPRPPRDEDDDGFGDEDEDDFVPVPKAAKPGAKPGKLAAKGGLPAEIDLDDGGDDGVIAPFEEEEDDDFGGAPKPRSLVSEADAAAMEAETRKKSARAGGGARDSARDKLIELGKQKGFVTYDEVNDHMPEDVVSTDQIDGWLAALGEHGIEVVDGAGGRRAGDIVDQAPKGLELEKEKEEGEVDEDEEYAYSRTSDPVRMYLRKMGSVSLLTREGEVEIAKRIEDGERKMLQAVLNSSVAVEELIAIGDRLRHGKIRVKDVVKDIDEDEAEFNEQFYVDRVCKIIDKVKKLQRDTEKLEEKYDEGAASESKKKKVKEAQKANRAQMFEELSDLRLNKPTVDRIVMQLKNIIVKLDKAELEIRECERKAGTNASEIRKTLREMRANPARARAVGKKTMMTVADFEEMEEMIKQAMRKVAVIEEEARSTAPELRSTFRDLHEGERMADRAKSE
ncbi:MAG: RNA polymerase sigma factor region1.1 domain-containing protein, partial [Kofleriaceae bacterium]